MRDENIKPLTADNDAWHQAVKLFTGYDAPLRNKLFEELIGNAGIPQMKVEISKQSAVDYVDPNDFNWRVENAGWRIENTDFVIPFYLTGGDNPSSGDRVSMYKARITLLGNKGSDGPPAGGVVEGGEFKSQYDNHLGLTGDAAVWTTQPLTQYSYGTGRALEALLNDRNGTHGFHWNGKNVANDQAVTLTSFDTAAASFDRAAQFFVDRRDAVEEWEQRLGTEQDDAWRGQAAGVFWNLVHTLGKQYDGYAKDMRPSGTTGSRQGDELRQAKTDFRNAVSTLQRSWARWELMEGNPLRWLHDLLVEVTDHVWERNIKMITYKVSSNRYGTTTTYHAMSGFDQTATRFGKGDNFGQLDDLDTWKKVGERAIQHWQASVIESLEVPANEAIRQVHNSWSTKNFDLGSIRTRSSTDLTSSYNEDKNEKKEDDAEKAAADAAKKQEEFMAWQKEQAAKAEAEAKRREEEAKKEQERREKEADEKEAKAKEEQERKEKEAEAKEAALRAEQERKEQEAKAEQERKEQEAKAEQERREKEAGAKEEQARAEQERKEAEAEAKAGEKEAEAEQRQAEAEAKAEQKEAEQEAKQAEAEAKAEEKQREQEAKQEEAQRKQEEARLRQEQVQLGQFNQSRTDQERARKEQEQKEAEAEAKAAEKEREAEAKQAEAEAEAEQRQAEAEAKAEQKEAEQEAKQAEAEAKAEERQREQEAKQEEAQAKAEAAQRERQEEQGRLQTEQELRQEQLLTEQEKREAEQRAEVEARQAEAQARQEAAVEQARAAQEQARGQQLPGGPDRPGSVELPGGQLNPGDLSSLMPGPTGGPVYSDNGLTLPDGTSTTIDDNGRIVTHHPDGSTVTIDPDLHTATVTRPDGTTATGPLNIGDRLPHPDGSVSHIGADGRIVTEYPDGTTTTIDPDTGIGITTRPDGTVTSGHLGGDGTLPGGSGPHSSLPSGHRPPSYEGSLGSYEEELYDHTPYEPSFAGSSSGPGPSYGALGDVGTPLNTGSLPGSGSGSGAGAGGPAGPMGAPMGGMGGPMGGMGGGGAGGGSGTSERVRNVIDDGRVNGGPRGGRPRPASPRGGQDENDVRVSSPRATATGGAPFAPMGGGGPGQQQQTQSGDRTRDAWVQEEEDVWGTDEGGAPAVIGR
ncbi:AAWKG family protein [Streptomyces antarcticus]|uniref:AAWKG family protein n=1 Tax=Streptomyces antarcticus TaxID=2996458 RepID=UPI00226E9215|nr:MULTISPECIES: AAWKG family protein [unclassified Streptomyces]MCY0941823.1 AAWKG family protein [Streptomyces sp. H34-AA3]MCZ4086813.1 AAWKG family protein [Streptomyces sp. H34-S5]